jgi:alcohol dehydrogenase class IV
VHVPRAGVLALAAEVKRLGPDLIVTVGGGTPVDTVKLTLAALATGVSNEAGFDEIRIRVDAAGKRVTPVIPEPPLRQIIVPTTLSGAEFSNLGGRTDLVRKVKDLYAGRYIGGQTAILDPAVTIHTPDWLWLSTGLRAIDHAVETICSRAPQPFTDATCIHALKLLSKALPANRAYPGDLDKRLVSQLAVWLATTGLGRVDWGASHGIGRQLGAVAGVPHGYCSCVMLPSVLRWNRSVNAQRQALVADALGDPGGDAAEAVAKLIADLGLPNLLRDVGVRREHFDSIANGAMQNVFVRSNARPVNDPAQVLETLEMAW